MPKNGGFSINFPPGKKKSTDYTDHENPAPTLAEQAALARKTVKNLPAGTDGILVGEEQAQVRDSLRGGRDAGRKERARGAGGTKRGTRGGVRKGVFEAESAPLEPASNTSASRNVSFKGSVPKEKLSNASESPYAPVIEIEQYGIGKQVGPALYHSHETSSVTSDTETLSTDSPPIDRRKEGKVSLSSPLSLEAQKESTNSPVALDTAAMRRNANLTIDTLKQELYASNISPAEASAAWQGVRVTHDAILADLERYRSARTDEERSLIDASVRSNMALLQGDLTDSLYEARQTIMLERPKENSKPKKVKDSLAKLDTVLEASVHETVEEYVAPIELREKEIRARLSELEQEEIHRVGDPFKKNREPEVLQLEEELRGLEKQRQEIRRVNDVASVSGDLSTDSLTSAQDSRSATKIPEEYQSSSQTAPLVLDEVTKEYGDLKKAGFVPVGPNGNPLSPEDYVLGRFRGTIERNGKIISAQASEAPTVHPIDLVLEKQSQDEYYRLEEEGKLPLDSKGNLVSIFDYIDKAYADKKTGESSPLPADATPGEVRARLRSLKEKLTGIDKVEGERKLSAAELYDMRVDLFAGRHGLKDSLDSMRATRQAYFEARKLGLTRGYDEENLGDLKQAYDRSVFGWKTTLESMSDSLEGKDRAEALIIAKRDSLLGPNNLELEARKAALSEKGKTAFGKAEIWMGNIAKLPLTVPGFVFGQAGKGLAHLLNANSYQIPDSSKKISPERLKELKELTPKQRKALSEAAEADYARKYARAVGVLAGAGIATTLALIASPVAATGAFFTFTAYAARGAIGTLAGMGAANVTGGIFNKFFGNKRAEKLDTWLQKRPTTLEEYQEQQQAYKRNNSRVRAGERSAWKMVAAMLTGSGVGLASSPLTHDLLQHIGQLEGVQEAAKVVAEVNAHSAGAAEHALRVQEMAKTAEAASAHAAAPNVQPYSVSIDPGEGMDKLFVELRDHYKEIYPDPNAATVPPGVRHILNAHSGDELSREFGFINEGNDSYVMNEGDRLSFDAQGNLVFTPAASGAQSIELLKEGVPHHLTAAEQQGHFIRHAEASMAGTHPSPEAHVTSATTVPSGEDPSAMLNRLQTVHPSELAGHEEVLRAEPGSLGAEDIHSYEAPTISDSTLDTYTPEQPPAAPVAESQPSEPAPAVEKPEPAPVAPETPSAPAQAPESVTAHAFAEPGAPQAMNPHGVDLNKPQLLVNNGLKFAHGVDTDDSYSRAFAESQRLFGEGAKDTNVYFVARDYDALGNPYLAVRMVFTPPDGSTPQMAPYGEGVSLSPEFTMPPLPKDADYKPLS